MKDYLGKCNTCGKCCKCIPVSFKTSKSIAEYKEWISKTSVDEYNKNPERILTQDDYDLIFIAENMVKITLAEAREIMPSIDGRSRVPYKCNALINNKCSKYDERPRMCSEYPNYKHLIGNPIELINKADCGYKLRKDKN